MSNKPIQLTHYRTVAWKCVLCDRECSVSEKDFPLANGVISYGCHCHKVYIVRFDGKGSVEEDPSLEQVFTITRYPTVMEVCLAWDCNKHACGGMDDGDWGKALAQAIGICWQQHADEIIAHIRGEQSTSETRREPLNLGQIIERLEAIRDKDERYVYFDFEHLYPTKLTSWRGIYAHLALCFDSEEENDAPTVAALLAKLKDAIGATYEGYKGGMFHMSEKTPVWVANWGNSGSTVIVNVLESHATKTVILETQYQDM